MERVILHSDINSCFVSIELLSHPELRGAAVAVAGDASKRHGIILAKSEQAKRAGVKTGQAIWQAKAACPELVLLEPHYDRYLEFSRMAQELYSEYTDRREPFGIDESWLDLTGCAAHRDGRTAACEIGRRMKKELGVTVSVGVSWNKVFAKLGSDYKKPDAVTVFDRENYRSLVWPLPVSDLLYVGPATTRVLAETGIRTIGELAEADPELLRLRLGKNGLLLSSYARGLDTEPVRRWEDVPPMKSIGNSVTPPRDLLCDGDVRAVLLSLAETVGGRLRSGGCKAGLAEISLRKADTLSWSGRQTLLPRPTDLTRELFQCCWELFRQLHHWPGALRGVGIRLSALQSASAPEQLDLFTDPHRREALRRLDRAVDGVRERFGRDAIGYLGSAREAPGFTSFSMMA